MRAPGAPRAPPSFPPFPPLHLALAHSYFKLFRHQPWSTPPPLAPSLELLHQLYHHPRHRELAAFPVCTSPPAESRRSVVVVFNCRRHRSLSSLKASPCHLAIENVSNIIASFPSSHQCPRSRPIHRCSPAALGSRASVASVLMWQSHMALR